MSYKSLKYGCCLVYLLKPNNKFNGHEYVDLGLPSGILWAKMNVGATNETDPGLYFAWGETTGYKAEQLGIDRNFTWEEYKWSSKGKTRKENKDYHLTKYCPAGSCDPNYEGDNLVVLEPSDDAATANMGSNWRTPTDEQFAELFSETIHGTVTSNNTFIPFKEDYSTDYVPIINIQDIDFNGLLGYLFFSKECASWKDVISKGYLFIPFGSYLDSNGDPIDGIWTSTLASYTNSEWAVNFQIQIAHSYSKGLMLRYYGLNVRGITKPTDPYLKDGEIGYLYESYMNLVILLIADSNSLMEGMKNVLIDNNGVAFITSKKALGMTVLEAYEAGYITKFTDITSDLLEQMMPFLVPISEVLNKTILDKTLEGAPKWPELEDFPEKINEGEVGYSLDSNDLSLKLCTKEENNSIAFLYFNNNNLYYPAIIYDNQAFGHTIEEAISLGFVGPYLDKELVSINPEDKLITDYYSSIILNKPCDESISEFLSDGEVGKYYSNLEVYLIKLTIRNGNIVPGSASFKNVIMLYNNGETIQYYMCKLLTDAIGLTVESALFLNYIYPGDVVDDIDNYCLIDTVLKETILTKDFLPQGIK